MSSGKKLKRKYENGTQHKNFENHCSRAHLTQNKTDYPVPILKMPQQNFP
jgi:hypothetical protein